MSSRIALIGAVLLLMLAVGAVWMNLEQNDMPRERPPAGSGIRDAFGQPVAGKLPFRRIVSLYSAHTENLFALGPGDVLLGVSRSETHPPEALAKPVFDPKSGAERFLAAKPDLVLARPMLVRGYPVLMEHLRRGGVTVVSLQPRSAEAMTDYWRALGTLTGREAEAEAMVRRFRDGLAAIRRRVAAVPPADRPGVYFESMHRKMKTFAPASIAMFVLREAGGRNVADDAAAVRGSNIAAYGKERILRKAEAIDVFLAQRGAMNDVTLEAIRAESGFGAIKAVRTGRILIVPEPLVSRPTPRLLEGIERISRFLLPEVWEDEEEETGEDDAEANRDIAGAVLHPRRSLAVSR